MTPDPELWEAIICAWDALVRVALVHLLRRGSRGSIASLPWLAVRLLADQNSSPTGENAINNSSARSPSAAKIEHATLMLMGSGLVEQSREMRASLFRLTSAGIACVSRQISAPEPDQVGTSERGPLESAPLTPLFANGSQPDVLVVRRPRFDTASDAPAIDSLHWCESSFCKDELAPFGSAFWIGDVRFDSPIFCEAGEIRDVARSAFVAGARLANNRHSIYFNHPPTAEVSNAGSGEVALRPRHAAYVGREPSEDPPLVFVTNSSLQAVVAAAWREGQRGFRLAAQEVLPGVRVHVCAEMLPLELSSVALAASRLYAIDAIIDCAVSRGSRPEEALLEHVEATLDAIVQWAQEVKAALGDEALEMPGIRDIKPLLSIRRGL